MNQKQQLAQQARQMCTKLRYSSMPIADVIPLLQQLADAVDGCTCDGNSRGRAERVQRAVELRMRAAERQAAKMDEEILKGAFDVVCPEGGEIDGPKLAEFMQRSPEHAKLVRRMIGTPKSWAMRDDYLADIGWEYFDDKTTEPHT